MSLKHHRFLFALALTILLSACAANVARNSVSFSEPPVFSTTTESFSKESGSSSSEDHAVSSLSSAENSSLSSDAIAYFSKIDFNKTGNALRGDLGALLNAKSYSSPSYSDLKKSLPKCDLDPAGSGTMLGFYNRKKLPAYWNDSWNREHVWPKSRGVGEKGPGSDPHMLRPSDAKINSSRGNNFYGFSKDGKCYDPGCEGYPEYRGIAARIIFYVATRYWKNYGLELSDNPNDSASMKTMGKLSRLLEWNRQYPVDATETFRNKVLAEMYNVRNPFIDCPSLADSIWRA